MDMRSQIRAATTTWGWNSGYAKVLKLLQILNAMTKADIRVYQMDIDSYDVKFKRVIKPKLVIKRKPETTASK